MFINDRERASALSIVMATQGPAHVVAIDDDPSIRTMIADYLGDNDVRVMRSAAAARSPASWCAKRSTS
jgi:hypothetical protein